MKTNIITEYFNKSLQWIKSKCAMGYSVLLLIAGVTTWSMAKFKWHKKLLKICKKLLCVTPKPREHIDVAVPYISNENDPSIINEANPHPQQGSSFIQQSDTTELSQFGQHSTCGCIDLRCNI